MENYKAELHPCNWAGCGVDLGFWENVRGVMYRDVKDRGEIITPV